jgi:hypothetical protein
MAVAARRPRRSTGRPSAITKLADAPHFHKWLIHADSGTGKTVFGGTAPNALFWTIEAQGTESAAVAGSTADQWVLNNAKDLHEATDYMVNGSGCDDYDWLLVDSLSEAEDKIVDEILWEGNRKNPKRTLDKLALDDYGVRDMRMMQLVDKLNRLPVNVLYTTHTMRFETADEDGDDLVLLQPLLGSTNNGKLSAKVCGKVTMVGHLAVRTTKEEGKAREYRRLYTQKTAGIFAKNRSGLGPFVDNPTIPKLLDKVAASRTAEPAPARRSTRTRRSAR